MKEKVEFNYDLKFVVATAAKIFIEKQLYDRNDLLFIFHSHQYIRAQVKEEYWNAHLNEDSFAEQCMAFLKKRYPEGANLDEKIFNEVANDIMTKITDKLSFVTAYSKIDDIDMNNYAECVVLRHKILCRFLEHYKAILDLILEFFGKNQVIEGAFTNDEIADFVQNHIIVSSNFTNKITICKDIRRFGVSKLLQEALL